MNSQTVSIAVDYALRSTLVLGVALLAVLALRRRSAAWRHMVWLAALISLAALPAAREFAPRWNAPAAASQILSAPARTVITVTAQAGSDRHIDWALYLWLAGVCGLCVRFVRAQVLAARLVRNATTGPAEDALVSTDTDIPLVSGIASPVILLPDESSNWPRQRLESVLAHERMHVMRRDTLWQAAAQLVCAFYWPNPLVWLAAAALRRECEQACDDGVLARGTKASTYAEHLIEIARAVAHRARATAFEGGIAMTRTNQLEERISALLNPARDRRPAGLRFAATVMGAAMALVLTLSAVRTPVLAQGKLTGVVRDASGAVIPRARIDVQTTTPMKVMTKDGQTQIGKPMHEVLYSNPAGEFSFDGIPDGVYTVTISAPGFARQEHQGFNFESASAKAMNITLEVGKIQEHVQVRGEATSAAPASPAQAGPPQRIRVGGNVQAANLEYKVTPLYPSGAKADRVEGTVIFQAVIGKDGSILSLEQVNKLVDERLAQAASDAVKQWRYKPTLLNGNPIEVITQIDVNFTLTR